MLKKSLNSITQWQDRDTEPMYSSFKPIGSNIFSEGRRLIYCFNFQYKVNCECFLTLDSLSGNLSMNTKEKQKMHKKHKRRLSDGGKARLKNMSGNNRTSLSATSSPALSRKSASAKTKVLEDKSGSKSSLIYDADKSAVLSSYSNKVSDDINEMVEQIQAIQNDISELAGRPISLVGSKR